MVLAVGLFWWALAWDMIVILWRKNKNVRSWVWEKKLAWILIIANTVQSHFNNDSPVLFVFFFLVWILIIEVVAAIYLGNMVWKNKGQDIDSESIDTKTEIQQQRIKFIILVIIFSAEFLAQSVYNHSFISSIKAIMPSGTGEFEDY